MSLLPFLVACVTAEPDVPILAVPDAPHAEPPAPPPPDLLRIDRLGAQIGFGVIDGVTGAAFEANGAPLQEEFRLQLFQTPEGYSSAAYRCELTWQAPVTTPVDAGGLVGPWEGAAWRVDTSGPPTASSGCDRLDPAVFGPDPVGTLAAAGWTFGLGPMRPSIEFLCPSGPRYGDSAVTVYLWMDGARPMALGSAQGDAVDGDGRLTGEDLTDAASAAALPDGRFLSACTFPLPI